MTEAKFQGWMVLGHHHNDQLHVLVLHHSFNQEVFQLLKSFVPRLIKLKGILYGAHDEIWTFEIRTVKNSTVSV